MKSHIRSITHLITLFLASAGILAPALAFAQVGVSVTFGSGGGTAPANDITGVASTILYLINDVLVPVLFAIAFIVFLYGVAKAYIFSGGDQESVSQGHKLILWGLIAFVVMISLWGLVNVIANTFGLSGAEAPALPQTPTTP